MFGQQYSFSADSNAYPRYKFFRSRLKDLFPTVDTALEANRLTDFVSQGLTTWKTIKDCVEACTNPETTLSVCVFAAKKAHLDLVKDGLVRDKSVFGVESKQDEVPEEYVEEKEIKWQAVRDEGNSSSRFAPQIIVYIKGDTETAKTEALDILPQIQKDHLIVFDADTRSSTLYRDIHEVGDKEKILPLCQNIEFLLEENVVILLEEIGLFISKFGPKIVSPKKQGHTIQEQILSDLKETFKNSKVLKDLLPDKHDEKQIMEETKDIGSSDIEKEVAKKRGSIFHHKIRKFISRKVKCLVCDLISQKLGVPGSFMNEFMGETFFPLERKLEDALLKNGLPSFLADDDNLIEYFEKVAIICKTLCNALVNDAEAYMQKQFGVLKKFKPMQFELFGLLRQSQPRANTGSLPQVNIIPKELQNELLDLAFMEMCGTLHGTLTLIVTQQPTSQMLDKVSGIIQSHQYPYQYEIAVIEAWNRHIKLDKIEHGDGIFPIFCDGGKERLMEKLRKENKDDNISDDVKGSIGCFVLSGGTLYAVTCFHCVKHDYFKEEIRVQRVQKKVHFGVRSNYWLYQEYTLDMALIGVDRDIKDECEKSVVEEGGIAKDPTWKFSEVPATSEDLEACLVYKKGSSTGITKGYIAGHDFKTKHMKKLETKKGFNEHYNIFIDSNGAGNFSESGDSGSVVCMTDIPVDDKGQVKVISLLCGSITLKNSQDDTMSTYSYSCPIKEMLKEISKQQNCSQFTEAR